MTKVKEATTADRSFKQNSNGSLKENVLLFTNNTKLDCFNQQELGGILSFKIYREGRFSKTLQLTKIFRKMKINVFLLFKGGNNQ